VTTEQDPAARLNTCACGISFQRSVRLDFAAPASGFDGLVVHFGGRLNMSCKVMRAGGLIRACAMYVSFAFSLGS